MTYKHRFEKYNCDVCGEIIPKGTGFNFHPSDSGIEHVHTRCVNNALSISSGESTGYTNSMIRGSTIQ